MSKYSWPSTHGQQLPNCYEPLRYASEITSTSIQFSNFKDYLKEYYEIVNEACTLSYKDFPLRSCFLLQECVSISVPYNHDNHYLTIIARLFCKVVHKAESVHYFISVKTHMYCTVLLVGTLKICWLCVRSPELYRVHPMCKQPLLPVCFVRWPTKREMYIVSSVL